MFALGESLFWKDLTLDPGASEDEVHNAIWSHGIFKMISQQIQSCHILFWSPKKIFPVDTFDGIDLTVAQYLSLQVIKKWYSRWKSRREKRMMMV